MGLFYFKVMKKTAHECAARFLTTPAMFPTAASSE